MSMPARHDFIGRFAIAKDRTLRFVLEVNDEDGNPDPMAGRTPKLKFYNQDGTEALDASAGCTIPEAGKINVASLVALDEARYDYELWIEGGGEKDGLISGLADVRDPWDHA